MNVWAWKEGGGPLQITLSSSELVDLRTVVKWNGQRRRQVAAIDIVISLA